MAQDSNFAQKVQPIMTDLYDKYKKEVTEEQFIFSELGELSKIMTDISLTIKRIRYDPQSIRSSHKELMTKIETAEYAINQYLGDELSIKRIREQVVREVLFLKKTIEILKENADNHKPL